MAVKTVPAVNPEAFTVGIGAGVLLIVTIGVTGLTAGIVVAVLVITAAEGSDVITASMFFRF